MIRRLLLASAGAVALAGTAFAADLPPPPPPVYVPPPPLWTGFYIGVNAGYSWANSTSVSTVGVPVFTNPAFPLGAGSIASALAIVGTNTLSVNPNGFIGGGQIGYNYQFGSGWNRWVAGLEADIDGVAGSSGTATLGKFTVVPNFPAESYTSAIQVNKNLNYFGTVRGRFGFLVTPTLLAYATGGLAYGGVSNRTSIIAVESLGAAVYPAVGGFSSISNTRVGWTVGGGAEWMFLPNWSAKVEYLYYDLGTVSSNLILNQINLVAAGGPAPWGVAGVQTRTHYNGNVVRAGLNYHFNWGAPAPVVAKY